MEHEQKTCGLTNGFPDLPGYLCEVQPSQPQSQGEPQHGQGRKWCLKHFSKKFMVPVSVNRMLLISPNFSLNLLSGPYILLWMDFTYKTILLLV